MNTWKVNVVVECQEGLYLTVSEYAQFFKSEEMLSEEAVDDIMGPFKFTWTITGNTAHLKINVTNTTDRSCVIGWLEAKGYSYCRPV